MSIEFERPFKENVAIVGMGQDGKTNCLASLLNTQRNPYTLYDSLGILTKANFQPLDPKTQTIIKPRGELDRQNLFLKTCHDVWTQGNRVFAIDEISMYCTKHQMPPELNQVVNQGGNRNIAYWFTTRRVAQVHNDILGSCQHHFIFRTYLPQDVEWYSAVVPRNILEMSRKLPDYHFIYYRLGKEPRIMQPVKKIL